MGSLVHTGLGSSSLVAWHMSSTIPLLPREQLCNRYCSNKHTHTALTTQRVSFQGLLDAHVTVKYLTPKSKVSEC